jgi:hypothetical protein
MYNLFIGRYQSPHKGHQALFDTYLSKKMPVLIAIRDVKPDEKNPLPAKSVKALWDQLYQFEPLVQTIIIPDIVSVNYGRDVGYAVNEIELGAPLQGISASEIRSQILAGEHAWKEVVDPKIHDELERMIVHYAGHLE